MSLFVHDKYIYNSQTAISTVFLQSIHIMVSQSAHFQPVLLTDPSIKEQKKQTLCYKCFFFKLWVSLRLIKHFLYSLCVSLQLLSSNGETVEGTNGELHEKVKIEAWAEVDCQVVKPNMAPFNSLKSRDLMLVFVIHTISAHFFFLKKCKDPNKGNSWWEWNMSEIRRGYSLLFWSSAVSHSTLLLLSDPVCTHLHTVSVYCTCHGRWTISLKAAEVHTDWSQEDTDICIMLLWVDLHSLYYYLKIWTSWVQHCDAFY